MSTRTQNATNDLTSFTVRRMLAGLELDDCDAPLLDYLDFFAAHIPIETANFLHVAPRFDLLLDSEILDNKYRLSETIVKRLEETVASHLTPNRIAAIQQEVREGSPLEELLREVETSEADLILIGQQSLADSHGILAKKLARRADCNLLIVPSAAKRTLRKILVPIDFSDHAALALRTAVAMNQQLADLARIVCLHVYEMPDFAAFKIGKTEEQFEQMMETDRRHALKNFIEAHVPADQRATIQHEVILRSRPRISRYLMDFARTQDVDFIVMGARGHSGIHLLFVGSVTESVLSENKEIPTLIVR